MLCHRLMGLWRGERRRPGSNRHAWRKRGCWQFCIRPADRRPRTKLALLRVSTMPVSHPEQQQSASWRYVHELRRLSLSRYRTDQAARLNYSPVRRHSNTQTDDSLFRQFAITGQGYPPTQKEVKFRLWPKNKTKTRQCQKNTERETIASAWDNCSFAPRQEIEISPAPPRSDIRQIFTTAAGFKCAVSGWVRALSDETNCWIIHNGHYLSPLSRI